MFYMKYSLGLDIGVTSVGWAIINEDKQRIEDLGVRIFEKAEQPKTGESLSKPRRDARGLRRRLARRAKRVNSLQSIFIQEKLLTEAEITNLYPIKDTVKESPYYIRCKALDEKVSPKELYMAFHHIFKRRGYKSARKKVEESDKVTGPVLGNIKENTKLLSNYRTVGEMMYKDKKFSDHKRNQGGDYSHTILRADLEKEIKLVLQTQRAFGIHFSENFEKTILEDFNYQKGFATGDQLKKMVGYCTFEKKELRVAKHTHTFQLFSLLQRLTQIRIKNPDHDERRLTKSEIEVALLFAYSHKELSYKQLRKEINLTLNDTFNLVQYPRIKYGAEETVKEKDPEEKTKIGALATFYELTHATKKVLMEGKIEETKERIVSEKTWEHLFANNYNNIDTFATINTLYKTDEDIITNITIEIPEITDSEIQELLNFDYIQFGHLSLKALRKINVYLMEGLDYDKSCEKAGYDFKGKKQEKTKKLTSFFVDHLHENTPKREFDLVSNPVVKRSLSQTIKVINAIIDKHGSPYYIKIECARELGKNFDDRRKIIKSQNEGRESNEKIKEKIKEFGIAEPKSFDTVKFKLWKQQNCKCAYSQKIILEEELFGDNFVEVDHIIPWSRCGDDGNSNKVLVLKISNQEKMNRTPYEWFGNDESHWMSFEIFIKSLRLPYKKEQNLLTKKYKNNDWNIRALNDTRYITKYLKNHIENTLIFAEGENKQRVIATNGMTTAYLRKRWGLSKSREENNLHHAQDAAVVAVIGQDLIQKITSFSKSRELLGYLLNDKKIEGIDPDTGEKYSEEVIEGAKRMKDFYGQKMHRHFIEPWDGFAHEVRTRLNPDITDAEEMKRLLKEKKSYVYDDLSFVKPVFVSRMPRRGVTGQMHKETLRSPSFFIKGETKSSIKKDLTSLTLKDIENIAGESKDSALYKELKTRLELHNDKAEIAFKDPIYRKDKKGNNINIVRSVKIIDNSQNSGFIINNGKALVDNGGIARVDIFSKEVNGRKKYFTVPVYNHEIMKKELPARILPEFAGVTHIDETFIFCFSLYPNDLIKIKTKKEEKFGYYVSYGIANGQYRILNHMTSGRDDSISASITTAETLEKYQVDVLGNYSKVEHEKRVGRIVKK